MAKKKLFGNLFKKRKDKVIDRIFYNPSSSIPAVFKKRKDKVKEPVERGDLEVPQIRKETKKESSLQVTNNVFQPAIREDKIVEFLDACGLSSQLEPSEKKMFIAIAIEFQLNPFKREIYCVPYGKGEHRKLSIITGYEVYLKRAERTGLMDGFDLETTGKGNDMKSTVIIYRKDRQHPTKKTVHYSEYVQKKYDGTITKFWAEKPITMLEKVATAQGFRLAFPDELGGMPYTADELPDEMTQPRNVTPPVEKPAAKKDKGPDVVVEVPVEKKPEPKNVTPKEEPRKPEEVVKKVFSGTSPLTIQQDKVAEAYRLIAPHLSDTERVTFSAAMKNAKGDLEALKKLEVEFQTYVSTIAY